MRRAISFGLLAWCVGALILACSSSSGSTPAVDAGVDTGGGDVTDAPVDRARKSLTPTFHRTAATTCGKTRPPSVPGDGGGSDGGGPTCMVDGDCGAGNAGRCIKGQCSYDACYQDKDCASGEVCLCRDAEDIIPDIAIAPGQFKPTNTVCAAAPTCTIDNDCGSGGFCSPSYDPTTGKFTYACHLPDDECTNDDDCSCPADNRTDLCWFDPTKGHWACWLKDCR
jgi:hypothetical protein